MASIIQRAISQLKRLACGPIAATMFLIAPASADIGAFNAAVRAGDYKLAAQEAVATWPDLDRTRDDFGVIAREFAFASLVGGEFEHALTFATAAQSAPPQSDERDLHILLSEIMVHSATLQAEGKRQTRTAARDNLRSALQRRGDLPGFDLISLLSGNALISYQLDRRDWDQAGEDARLLARLAANGGPAFTVQARQFELGAISTVAMEGPDIETAQALHDFTKQIVSDLETAPSDEHALALLPVYWEAFAWSGAVQSYLWSSNNGPRTGSLIGTRRRPGTQECDCDKEDIAIPPRVHRLLGSAPEDENCEKKIEIDPPVKFPTSARRRGSIGAVLIAVDVDENGQASNGRLLAGVPEKYFAAAALERVPNMTYAPGETWDPEVCKLQQQHRVIEFVFQIGYR